MSFSTKYLNPANSQILAFSLSLSRLYIQVLGRMRVLSVKNPTCVTITLFWFWDTSIFFFSGTANICDVSTWLWFHNMKLILQQTAYNHLLFYILLPEKLNFFLQVRTAAFSISISVTAERISSLLMPLNILKSNIWTFFLWAASIQHPGNKLILRAW